MWRQKIAGDREARPDRVDHRPPRATVVTTQTATSVPAAQAEPQPERTIIPSDREGFRRAFANSPYAQRIATATPPTPTVARAVPDLATMSRTDRAVAMAAMIARIGQPRSAMMPAT